MSTTLYEKESGKVMIFAHTVDAKECLRAGFYITQDPNKKPEIIEEVKLEVEKSEVKPEIVKEIKQEPIKIPKVAEKKIIEKPVVEKFKPIEPKKSSRIIKK